MITVLSLVLLVIGLTLCCLVVLILLLKHKSSNFCKDEDQLIEVVKLVEALREACPVNSSRGWTLSNFQCGLRCWKRLLPFRFLGSHIMVFASSLAIEASAVALLNIVADVSTWPEWEPSVQRCTLQVGLSEDAELHGDPFMRSDQVIATKSEIRSAPEIMYRFGNLEKNGVGWIIIWHVIQLDWCFFLAQPLESASGSAHCLLTVVQGINPLLARKESVDSQVTSKLLNLRDAVVRNRLQFRPFLPLIVASALPTLPNAHVPMVRSALSDPSDEPNELLKAPDKNRDRSPAPRKRTTLALVPVARGKPATLKNLKGFILVLRRPSASEGGASLSPDKSRSKRRTRTRTGSSIAYQAVEMKEMEPNTRVCPSPSVTLTVPSNLSLSPTHRSHSTPPEDPKNYTKHSSGHSRSLSHVLLKPFAFVKRRSSDPSLHRENDGSQTCLVDATTADGPSPKTAKDPTTGKSTTDSGHRSTDSDGKGRSSPEPCMFPLDKTDLSDSLEVIELPVPALPMYEGSTADYKILGSRCAAEILREVFVASALDSSLPEEEQKSLYRGWTFQGMHKDITILMKMGTFGSLNTISYLCRGIIPASPAIVWNVVRQPLSRLMYDGTVKKVSLLQELPTGQKILHTHHESVSLLKKEVHDFSLLQTEKEDGPRLVVALQSIESSKCPLTKDVTRGFALPSGWVIEPLASSTCSSVTSLLQVIISTPDSLFIDDLGSMQPHCISNLRTYIKSDPMFAHDARSAS